MPQKIKIKKGLNIPLNGVAEKLTTQVPYQGSLFAIRPTDFTNLTPKPVAKEGDKVLAGDVLFTDKYRTDIKITAPVSGVLKSILRGERRKILEFIIEPDDNIEYRKFETGDLANLDRQKVTELLIESGIWPLIRQRPFDIIANPNDKPKAIFISGFDSSPLAPDYDFILIGQEQLFQKGIDVLKKLTDGAVNLTVNGSCNISKVYQAVKGVELNTITGPHPAGNVGIQIHHINPVNKGEVVWHINPQDVLIIGRLFTKGIFDASRTIAVTGSEILKPRYYKTIIGASIKLFTSNNITNGHLRYISGNPLTGIKISKDGFLGFYHNQITVIPEGNDYEMFGWALPGFKKFSTSRTFLSGFFAKKQYNINANLHGGIRPFVFTGEYEKVLPMDIYPVYLLKAILAQDIDQMEQLGIYEVAEEDFALCEFVCTSKIPVQKILKQGIELMIRETK